VELDAVVPDELVPQAEMPRTSTPLSSPNTVGANGMREELCMRVTGVLVTSGVFGTAAYRPG
jgi:hypothetical protein